MITPTPTLIVIEDRPLAYEMCCELKRWSKFDSSVINIDLSHSRTIVENEEKRIQSQNTMSISPDDTQTYKEIVDYLSSKDAPRNLILILDLALAFDLELEKNIHKINNFPSTGTLATNTTQAAALSIACCSIKNQKIKKLLICFATTAVGSNQGAEYDYLKQYIRDEKTSPTKQRQVTVVSSLREIKSIDENENQIGGPFAPENQTTSIQLEYSSIFLSNAIFIFNNSGNLPKRTYKFIIEGNVNENGETENLSLKIDNKLVASGKTAYYAEVIYKLKISNGLKFLEIVSIKVPNSMPSMPKDRATKFLSDCTRHIKNKCKNDIKMTDIFCESGEKYYLAADIDVDIKVVDRT
jgi:hypothetical protein